MIDLEKNKEYQKLIHNFFDVAKCDNIDVIYSPKDEDVRDILDFLEKDVNDFIEGLIWEEMGRRMWAQVLGCQPKRTIWQRFKNWCGSPEYVPNWLIVLDAALAGWLLGLILVGNGGI